MNSLVILYLAGILAGFALTKLPSLTFLTPGLETFLASIGGIAIIVFAFAILILGVKSLLRKA